MDFKCRRINNICGWRNILVLSFLAVVLFSILSYTKTALPYPILTLGQKNDAAQSVSLVIPRTDSSHDNSRRTRILCLILTTTSGKNKMVAVKDTWARRCNKHLFIYGQSNLSETGDNLYLPVPEGREHLTAKVRYALQYAHRTYNDSFDWILKGDDDTYVIVENLRYLLSHADPEKPGYFGYHMKTPITKRYGYMSGGGGYVISSSALDQLIKIGFQNDSCRQDGGSEDEEIGLCLAKSGVPVLRSLDTFGRESFHPEALDKFVYPPHPTWLHGYAWNQPPKYGEECCSKFSISFHHVSPQQIVLYDHLLYKTEVHGRKEDKQNTLPVFSPRIEKPAF